MSCLLLRHWQQLFHFRWQYKCFPVRVQTLQERQPAKPAAFFQIGQQGTPSQLGCSDKMPRGGNSVPPGDQETGADMQHDMAAAPAAQGKRKLDSCASEAGRSAKRPCSSASMCEPEPHQALVTYPETEPITPGCPRTAGCAATPEQSGSAQRRESAQTDSRVRMKAAGAGTCAGPPRHQVPLARLQPTQELAFRCPQTS